MKKMAVVMPSLYVGGGELFTYYMIKNTNSNKIDWRIVIIIGEYADETLLKRYSMICHVWFNKRMYYKGETISVAFENALTILENCDGVVGWELVEERAAVFNLCRGTKYYLIFRHDEQHKKWTRSDYVLIANSVSCIEDFGEIGNRHVHIVPSCFSKEHIQVSISRDIMRNKFGVYDDRVVVGFIGRMDYNKNPLAIARVASIDNRITVCAFGQKSWESSGLEQDIEKTSRGRMIWHNPVFPIGNVLNAIDVFVQTSYSEVFSLALLEAWAFGVPTVSTATGMVPFLNEHYGGICKLINQDDEPQIIKSAIQEAINDKKMVNRAYKMANSEFSEQQFGEIWSSIILGETS